jgi:hypothetical protein
MAAFGAALTVRFGLQMHTSEDAIRYTCFHCLLNELDCGPERLVLEHPHPGRERALIDAWLKAHEGMPDIAMEFKFHRVPVGSVMDLPRPQSAGSLLGDIFKLAQVRSDDPIRRVLVYVAGPEMTFYFQNPANGLNALFELELDAELVVDGQLLEGRADTLVAAAGTPVPARVIRLHAQATGPFAVRVWEISPI